MPEPDVQRLIDTLGLQPHPEGGWYIETFRHDPGDGSRGASTAIYYLLTAGDRSAWHRVTDADEIWHWYAGGPLALTVSSDGHDAVAYRLGPDLAAGERPQAVVRAGHWQTAESLGRWTLMGCTVAPAFEFDSLEMAPDTPLPFRRRGMTYDEIAARLAGDGLLARGGFLTGPDDLAPEFCRTVILVGNADAAFWAYFEAGRRDEPNPLDAWTRRVVGRVAAAAGGWAVYPSDGPPYFPFQRWARKAESVYPSPIGMLIHPDHGLWHVYRAALCLHGEIDLPSRGDRPSPCDSCADKPCLTTCPVSAFDGKGYDVPACKAFIRSVDGADCIAEGCRARRACPIAGPHLYAPGQAAFHMRAFERAWD